LSVVLISHDLAAVARYCDEILVMHEGRAVDHGATAEVLTTARHPVTRELLDAAASIVS
jgi:ABC-type dipeptide/oligopeptide/nickel transport system ATPase component